MKIGFLSESPADQAALAVFTEGILGVPPEPISMDLEAHSIPAIFSALDGIFRGLYYGSDAEGLVVVVDSDDSVLHDPAHDEPGVTEDRCRFCKIRAIITRVQRQVKPIKGRTPLRVAVGLAVPTIEAWYLVGKNHEVGEAAWKVGIQAGKRPFSNPQLKEWVYGTDRPSLEQETDCAVKEARRIIAELKSAEATFPIGFGSMAQAIRSWTA